MLSSRVRILHISICLEINLQRRYHPDLGMPSGLGIIV